MQNQEDLPRSQRAGPDLASTLKPSREPTYPPYRVTALLNVLHPLMHMLYTYAQTKVTDLIAAADVHQESSDLVRVITNHFPLGIKSHRASAVSTSLNSPY